MFMVIIFVLGVAWLGREKRPVRAGTRAGQPKPVKEKPYKLTKADKMEIGLGVAREIEARDGSYEEQKFALQSLGLTKADQKAIFELMDGGYM